jgi:hypothetical protein
MLALRSSAHHVNVMPSSLSVRRRNATKSECWQRLCKRITTFLRSMPSFLQSFNRDILTIVRTQIERIPF